MANCEFCTWEVGKELTLVVNPNSACENCGYTFGCSYHVIYKGIFQKPDQQKMHGFKVLSEAYCPECGIEIKGFWVPCGGSYIWEFGAVSEEALIDIADRANKG